MSKEKRRQWGIRLDEKARSTMEKAIKHDIATRGLSGQSATSDAVKNIAERYFLGVPEKETISFIPEKVIPGYFLDLKERVDCAYLRYDHALISCVCDETVLSSGKRASAVLGNDPVVVFAKCEAHKLRLYELEKQKIRAMLKGDTIAMLKDMLKTLIKIKRDGFDDVCFMCLAGLFEGRFAFSEDSVNLQCENRDMAYVDIDKICRQTINPSTRAPPCEYFLEAVHAANLDKLEDIKKLTEAEVFATACTAHGTPECLGVPQCTVDLVALAKMKKYCPDRYSPETDIPLLEELEETPE